MLMTGCLGIHNKNLMTLEFCMKTDLISQERAVIYLYQYNGIPNNLTLFGQSWAILSYCILTEKTFIFQLGLL